MAVARDVIDKSGSWYSYNNMRIGQGRENLKAYLDEHEDVKNEIRARIREFGAEEPDAAVPDAAAAPEPEAEEA